MKLGGGEQVGAGGGGAAGRAAEGKQSALPALFGSEFTAFQALRHAGGVPWRRVRRGSWLHQVAGRSLARPAPYALDHPEATQEPAARGSAAIGSKQEHPPLARNGACFRSVSGCSEEVAGNAMNGGREHGNADRRACIMSHAGERGQQRAAAPAQAAGWPPFPLPLVTVDAAIFCIASGSIKCRGEGPLAARRTRGNAWHRQGR